MHLLLDSTEFELLSDAVRNLLLAPPYESAGAGSAGGAGAGSAADRADRARNAEYHVVEQHRAAPFELGAKDGRCGAPRFLSNGSLPLRTAGAVPHASPLTDRFL